jgi:hypothetical protein
MSSRPAANALRQRVTDVFFCPLILPPTRLAQKGHQAREVIFVQVSDHTHAEVVPGTRAKAKQVRDAFSNLIVWKPCPPHAHVLTVIEATKSLRGDRVLDDRSFRERRNDEITERSTRRLSQDHECFNCFARGA